VGVADRSQVGTDEWVARVDERRTEQKGLTGAVARAWERLPAAGRLVVLLGPFAIFPFITNEGNLYRYGLITIIYALLAMGLNVVVGFAGLLDLGYVAFFGFGAYLYGIMASGHSGHHLQAEIAIPIVTVSTALLGLLLGLTSWRLLGDYLAIVTLFFLQAFVIFVNNANGGRNASSSKAPLMPALARPPEPTPVLLQEGMHRVDQPAAAPTNVPSTATPASAKK